MGGINSGRRDQGGKSTTEDCRALDVRHLQRDGLLSAGRSFSVDWTRNGNKVASIQVRAEADRVILDYRHQRNGGEWKPVKYPVRIEWTPCNYGGSRAWFRCPADGCTRRVAKLFLGSSGIFACRHCYQLAYASQRENVDDRATRQANKIRDRLKWEPGILNGHGEKPKGMRWKTYWRLAVEHDALVNISLRWMQQRMKKLEDKLGGFGDDLNLFRKIEV
ncbi:MAG: hypothetical protein PSV17_11650 [Methylotenera sp.]|uniref:hypothetical protein n=1 Tax=Methylotenera sp. TaxID=2051956 RepID=UPI00248A7F9E|nr:hypothetical protein [Methylotenera sp.]MDI1310064.1 hypothetical protein [Methylotenera sp.]